MNNIKIFENAEFGQVRTVMIDGEPWFVGKDVAVALGYEKPTDTVRKHVDEEDRGISKMETPSGMQETTIINESGLYALILVGVKVNLSFSINYIHGQIQKIRRSVIFQEKRFMKIHFI